MQVGGGGPSLTGLAGTAVRSTGEGTVPAVREPAPVVLAGGSLLNRAAATGGTPRGSLYARRSRS